VRTAIVSDLHLSGLFGEDVARDAGIRRAMLDEIGSAERVVLLGDVIELRERAIGAAMAASRPFFEDLGRALAGREIVLVPGNHDHRFAEPLLDQLSITGGGALGLEHRFRPSPGPAALLQEWLGEARLELAYPGIWLRDDVYATHGHYMDCHLSLPRIECIAAAAAMRRRGIPDQAAPVDYERVLRPIYGFGFARAQARRGARVASAMERPSEAVWRMIGGTGMGEPLRRRLLARAVRGGVPASIWGVNRLLRADFDADLSPQAIFRSGVAAATEMSTRLRVGAAHVITGHTHRAGPSEDEAAWELPSGGVLHNTGSWVFATAFHHPGRPPNSYWPGTVTWLEDEGAPRRVELLRDRPHAELAATVAATLAGRRAR
jgi:hypothetical protein